MHPFHLSQAIYFGAIIIFIGVLFMYEKISKRNIPKTKIFVYSLTIVLLMSFVISFYFYIRYDYSLVFPADYFQPHNYLFAIFALIILGSKFSQKDQESPKLTRKDKFLFCCSLVLIILIMVVPTSEKVADNHQYRKAEEVLAEEENNINAAITHDVSSCRENPEYRKTYQAFYCGAEGSRVYYMFAKNTTSETQHVVIHLSLLDQDNEQINSFSSKEMILQPDSTDKVLFDSDVFNQPDWMQHSFYSPKQFAAYQYEIEIISNKENK